MPEVIAHEAQIDLLVRHVGPCAVTQPVGRCLPEAVRARRLVFTTRTQGLRRTAKDILHDPVQRCARQLDEAARRADRKDADHRRLLETVQGQLGDARHQTGLLQGRLDAVEVEKNRLQDELMTLREAEARARETRASSALTEIRKAPRSTRAARTAPTVKAATRRKKTL